MKWGNCVYRSRVAYDSFVLTVLNMDHCESVDKDADRTVLRENSEVEDLVMSSNRDGESLIVMSN